MAWWTKISRLIIMMMMITLPVALMGCSSGSTTNGNGEGGTGDGGAVTLKSIQVSPATDSVAVGAATQFTATANFSDGTTKSVTTATGIAWSSSTPATATIGAATGLATPLAVGTTTITAKFQGASGTATLTVKAATLKSISVAPATATIAVGASQTFTATGVYDDGTTHALPTIAWTSGTAATASIASTGVALGLAAGTTTITATSGGVSGTATLTVTAAVLQSIQVTSASPSVLIGATDQFTATGNYGAGVTMDITALVTWTSATLTVGTIDPGPSATGGLATAVTAGTSVITATLGSISGTGSLVVTGQTITSIAVTPPMASISIGQTQQFTATATLSDMTTQDVTSSAMWQSSTLATATVTGGLATGVAIGTTTITATVSGISGTAALAVTNATLKSCTIGPANPATVTVGGMVQLKATGVFTDGTTNDITTTSAWTSSDATLATVGAATGLVTGVKGGAPIITSTTGSGTAAIACTDVVVVSGATVVSISVTPSNPTIAKGTTEQFTATATLSDGTTQNITSSASWTSGTLATATISATGLATAVANGTSVITATSQSVSGTTTLTVSPATLASLTISPSAPQSLALGTTLAYTATGTYSDGSTQDLTSTASFTAAPVGFVTFAANVASAAKAGTATVTATVGTITSSNSDVVTVINATIKSIAVTPAGPVALHIGGDQQFKATATFTDLTTQDVTATAAWVSSTPATATVGAANGLAVGVKAGTTNITATVGTIVSPVVVVNVSLATLVSIAVTPVAPPASKLNVGATLQFTATATYSDASTGDVSATVSWVSAAPADFTVSATGLVTGVASTGVTGTTSNTFALTATIGTIVGTAQVAVTSATIKTIAVACTSPNANNANDLTCIPTGIGLQLDCSATATYTDGSVGNITNTAAWTSSAATTASTAGLTTIGANQFELVTINATAGSSNITAAQGGITSNTVVTSAIAESLNLTANQCAGSGALAVLNAAGGCSPGGTLAAGTTNQFSAVASYTTAGACLNETRFNVAPLATWATVTTTIATVSNAAGSQGLVSAVAAGTTSLSATFGGQSGTYSVTVGGACLQSLAIAQTGNTYPIDISLPLTLNAVFSGSANPVALTPAVAATYVTWGVTNVGSSAVFPATVPNANALFVDTGTTAGTATVTATANAGTSCTGTVKGVATIKTDATTLPTALAITPNPATPVAGVPTGTQITLTATASYGAPYNTTYPVAQYSTWTTVPASGQISYANDTASTNEIQSNTLTAAGSYTINAAYRNVTATDAETFTSAKTITSIAINTETVGAPTPVNYAPTYTALGVPGDLPVNFGVKITYSDGTSSNSLSGVTFASSNPAVLPNPNANGVATTITPAALATTNVTASITDPTDAKIFTSAAFTLTVNTATVTGLTFNPGSGVNMPLGTTLPVDIHATFSNGQPAEVSSLVTSSSPDTTVATVTTTATGTTVVSQQKASSVTLPITFDGFAANYIVNVTNTICYSSITVAPTTTPQVPFGGTQVFTAQLNGTDGSKLAFSGTWTPATNANLVNNGGGSFSVPKTGATQGTYNVTATQTGANICNGGTVGQTTVTQSEPITVVSATVVSLQAFMLDGTSGSNADATANLPLGTSRGIQVLGTFSNGTVADVTGSCTFASGDATIATVSAAGAITGVKAGAVGINVTYSPNPTITTVLNANVQSCGAPTVAMVPAGAVNVPVGLTQQFTATANYTNNAACPVGTWTANQLDFNATTLATWTSLTPAKATIGASTGLLTGVAPGTLTVTALYDGVTATNALVTVVTETLTAIVLNNNTAVSVPKGSTTNLSVAFTWNPVCAACTAPLTFNTGTAGIVSVNAGTYVLTGTAAGTTTLNASSGTVASAAINATVTAACVSSLSIATVPGNGTTIPVGVPVTTTITCQNSDGSACTNSNIVATPNGLSGSAATFLDFAAGTAAGKTGSLTASLSAGNGACGTGISQTASFTAGNATLQSIAISPSGATIQVGTNEVYQSEGTYTGTTGAGTYDISLAAALTSTNTPIANSINADTIHGIAMGSTNISSAFQGVTSPEIPLTVSDTNPALTALTITAAPNAVGLCASATAPCNAASAQYLAGGYTLPLFATGTYADGTKKDLTATVTWALGTFVVNGTLGTLTAPTISAAGVLTTGTAPGTQPVTASITIGATTTKQTFNVVIDAGTVTAAAIVTPADTAEPSPVKVAQDATAQLESTVTTGLSAFITANDTYWTTTNFAWASSAPAVGSVSNGLYTALGTTGTTNVTATKTTGGATLTAGPIVVDDSAATPSSIVCAIVSGSKTPGTDTLGAPGDTVQLYATVTFSDGSIVDETASVSAWNRTTGNASILTGGANAGLATAQAAGSDVITPQFTANGTTVTATAANGCTLTIQ